MDVSQAVARRRSIRVFEDRPVSEELLRRILGKAQMAPSSMNLQPWRAVVLAGEPLRDLSQRMLASAPQEPAEYEMVAPGTPPAYLARREAIMGPRMDSLGIARDDKAGRAEYQLKNYEFFGAPACLMAFVPRALSANNLGSMGLWLQTVMLLAVEEGLGTCPQESLANHARIIKQACGIGDAEYLLWCGLAIGWPVTDAPVNNYERPRAPLDESVSFVGFGTEK